MHAPAQIDPTSLADYLEVISRAALEPGLNWNVVEAKWPGILDAFARFDPETVAGFTPEDVERLMGDARIIRNRKKIEAIIHNAGELLVLDREPSGFRGWLRSHGSFEELSVALRAHFKFLGEMGVYHFLYVVKEPVPDYDEWKSSRPVRPRR